MTNLILINIAIWLIMLYMLGFTKYSFGGIAMFIVCLLVFTGPALLLIVKKRICLL